MSSDGRHIPPDGSPNLIGLCLSNRASCYPLRQIAPGKLHIAAKARIVGVCVGDVPSDDLHGGDGGRLLAGHDTTNSGGFAQATRFLANSTYSGLMSKPR